MAKTKAAEGSVKIGANLVLELKGMSMSKSANTIDQSTLADEWKAIAAGQKSWSANIEAFGDADDATGQGALAEGAEVALNYYPYGETSGDKYFSGNAIVTSVESSNAIDGMVEASFSVEGNGAVTENTVI